MNNVLGSLILLASIAAHGAAIYFWPGWIARNKFINGFLNHELLALLGVVLALTIASASQLYVTLNQIEMQHNTKNVFVKTRSQIKIGVYSMIFSFTIGIGIVFAKGAVRDDAFLAQDLLGAFAMTILLMYVLIMFSITEAIFAIKP